MSEIRIIVGGDVCPTRNNSRYFCAGDASLLFDNLLPEFRGADLNLINLECPLVQNATPVLKSGPVLQAHPDCAKALAAAGLNAVSVANNHALDHGIAGLKSTLESLKSVELDGFGAGENRAAAEQPLLRRFGDIRVGVLAVADREFSLGGRHDWCVNPLDVLACARRVPAMRRECHYVLVLLHGGVEHYPYPSPRMQAVAHFLVELGADLVVFQHSHCVGCWETYNSKTIVYGQGNLLFQIPQATLSWNEGILLDIRLTGEQSSRIDVIPIVQVPERGGVERMSAPRRDVLLEEFHRRSREIVSASFVEDQWLAFCRERADSYLGMLRGYGRIRGKLNRITGHLRRTMSSADVALVCNLVRCEAHQEILVTLLEDLCHQRQTSLLGS
jgi:poly-gamma-glutamate capsule biosynthesis protein CapA/YwtB (metallophosphatase superfamily)